MTGRVVAAGTVVTDGGSILLVEEHGYWSLPKGVVEADELASEAAIRETAEETGVTVSLYGLAFVTEFTTATDYHVQFFFDAVAEDATLDPHDPDGDVQDARFVPVSELREYLQFEPRRRPLERWLDGGVTVYFGGRDAGSSFDSLTLESGETS